MSENKCQMPACKEPAAGLFREMPLCSLHLEITRTWEHLLGGAVRLPTAAELWQARRDVVGFAEYAVDTFMRMSVKYGAVDFKSGEQAHKCSRHATRLIRAKGLKMYVFLRGATSWNTNDPATLYLVRTDLEASE